MCSVSYLLGRAKKDKHLLLSRLPPLTPLFGSTCRIAREGLDLKCWDANFSAFFLLPYGKHKTNHDLMHGTIPYLFEDLFCFVCRGYRNPSCEADIARLLNVLAGFFLSYLITLSVERERGGIEDNQPTNQPKQLWI